MRGKMEKGFSLVELSIVIVIIGLIIAGISVGSNLIESSRVRQLISDFDKARVAYLSFVRQYGALPGDMDNATTYLPSAVGNGDGDRIIENSGENFLFWNHLQNAELIYGKYTGQGEGGTNNAIIGLNIPSTFGGLGGLSIRDNNQIGPAIERRPATLSKFVFVGKEREGNNEATVAIFTPQLAYVIDNKFDDGLPVTGEMIVANGINSSANQCDDGAEYHKSENDGDICILLDIIYNKF